MTIDDMLRSILLSEEMRQAVYDQCKRAVNSVLSESAPKPEGLLTTTQAATFAGVTADTVRVWIRDGKLTRRRVGQRWRIDRDELARLLMAEVKCKKEPTIDQRAAAIVARHRGLRRR